MSEFIADLFVIETLFAVGIVVLGGIMHGFTGWGGGLVMMPLMSLLYDPTEALFIIATGGLILSAQMYPAAIRTANWPEMFPFFLTLAVLTPVGSVTLLYLDPALVLQVVGVAVIIAALLIISGWQYKGKRSLKSALSFGFVTGFVNGLTGTGGAGMVIYALAFPEDTKVQRANIVIGAGIMIFLITITLMIGGVVSWQVFALSVLLGPAQLAGGWIGLYLFKVAPQEFFRRVSLVALIVLGVTVLLR